MRSLVREITLVLLWASLLPLAAQTAATATKNAKPTHAETVTVTANVDQVELESPDPSEKVFVKEDLLDANPGRPGAPVSIPGYPIETASSGIKAPQYFAPGVAGDHGEPIAQYIAVGDFLLPNNLSANAHGNGYADPNLLIPQTLESVEVNGGAFNVLEGNHAVNLAATYGPRQVLGSYAMLTADEHDADLSAGLGRSVREWVALEVSFGNGLLRRLEHRQQYKLNAQRVWRLGQHELTVLGIAYFGTSYVPGLVPLANLPADDTIDPRQRDQTHTAAVAANDAWRLSARQAVELSGFFRTYNLALFSDFGDGLIRQSEFRTVAGSSTRYTNKISEAISLLAGFDYNREAPRRDNLDHFDFYTGSLADGAFTKVDSNNVTITSLTPYAAAAGGLGKHFRYYAGWRRDEIDIENQDLLHAANSFDRWVGVNSPKATVSFVPDALRSLPQISASFGEAFFTEDPRIGTGSAPGTLVARSHSYQLVANKTVKRTEVRLTLGHVTNSAELAKIDPDTGLQEDEGPSRLRFVTAAVRQGFGVGSLLVTASKADARDVADGLPTPEAPRTLVDALGSFDKLPWRMQAQAEFAYVGRKPLGTGCEPDPGAECVGTSVREFRAALARGFLHDRVTVGLNAEIAAGFTGQTTENFLPSLEQQVVGVRIHSNAGASLKYSFGR